MSELMRLQEAMAQIATIANSAANGADYEGPEIGGDATHNHGEGDPYRSSELACTLKSLPARLLEKAAVTARTINPVNAPLVNPSFSGLDAGMAMNGVLDPMRLAVLTSKYWGPMPRRLTVSFMGSTPANVRARIVSHMNAWTTTGCISFVETQGTGDVRVSREPGGYWSYLGTDILLIPRNRPTMNLEALSMSTSDAEYTRVVRHEAGHTLGFPHEHMRKALVARIDRSKAYDYFWRSQGWDRQTVDQQVLTSLDERSLMGTPPDQTSIMCYQLPGGITRDGKPILGGSDINRSDFAFVGRIYPKTRQAAASERRARYAAATEPEVALRDEPEDWPASDDAEVAV